MSSASAVVGLCAVLVAAGVLARTRDGTTALPVLLDLLLAAGLLRLSASGSWRAIATAAAIVVVRKMVVAGIRAGRTARQPTAGRPAG